MTRFWNSSILTAATFVTATNLSAQVQRTDATTIARAVDSLASRIVSAGLTPALGVAVVMSGSTIHLKSYGMADVTGQVAADERTLWYLASTSKSLTGFGVSLLAHRGVIDFNAPVSQLLPKAKWHRAVQPESLTLARFLSHTHYLNDDAVVMSAAFTGAVPEARWPEYIVYAAPTGSRDLVYSNFGYNVAAMVIDAKRPEGWKRFLEENVYRPVGMRDTYARVSGLDRRRIAMPHSLGADGRYITATFAKTDVTMNAAGGHLSTLGDLARWITVQMDSGMLDGRRVFPAEAVRRSHRMIAPQTREQAQRFAYFDREGWGAGWDIGTYEREPMVSRFGSYHSTRSHISFLPRRRVGVAAMATGRPGWSATDLIAAFVYDLEAGRADARDRAERRLQQLIMQRSNAVRQAAVSDSVRASRQRPLDRPLDRLAGTYGNPAFGHISFALRDGRLHFTWGVLSGPVEVFDAAKYQMRFEIAGGGQVAAFALGEDGRAREVSIDSNIFTRTK